MIKSKLSKIRGDLVLTLHDMAQLPTKVYILATYIWINLSVSVAHATQSSLFTGWHEMMLKIVQLLISAALLAGVGAVLYGLTQLVKKGMGRGDDVEWRQVYWPLGGGAMLATLMYMVEGLVAESGAGANDLGRRPDGGGFTAPTR